MKKIVRYPVLIILLLTYSLSLAQAGQIIKHTVAQGETIYSIARKYKTTPYQILKNNPGLNSDIKPGQIILIPLIEKPGLDSLKASGRYIAFKYHTVSENETVFSISKQYNTTIEDINKVNKIEDNNIKLGQIIIIPILPDPTGKIDTTRYTFYYVKPKEGKWRVAYNHGITVDELERLNPQIQGRNLQVNEKLVVPKNRADTKPETDKNFVYYEVKPLETIYSLTKRFDISEEELLRHNPQLTDGLKAGQILKIPRQKKPDDSSKQSGNRFFFHTVKPKETVYSLTKRFNISIEELMKYNPVLKDGLKAGQILRIPKPGFTVVFDLNAPFFFRLEKIKNPEEYTVDLLQNLHKNKTYKVALLLPFKLNRQNNTECSFIRKNKILDYYAGIRMAVDSLKKLGLNIRVDVFDTQADPNATDRILLKNDLTDYDFVLGPVYPGVIEKTASVLETFNTPVVVPSFRGINAYGNLVKTVTDSASLAQHMITFINEIKANDNLIVVFDEKAKPVADSVALSLGTLNMLAAHHSKHGNWLKDTDFKTYLKKGKNNLIILSTDDYSLIANILSVLDGLSTNYPLQLFLLEDSKAIRTLDVKKMAAVHLTFPSRSLKIIDPRLRKSVKENLGFYPNSTFINGYDTTFDLMLRLANADNLFDGLKKYGKTQETSRIYLYGFHAGQGFENVASYILRVNENLDLEVLDK